MPDAPLPPLPPVGQPRWRTAADELLERFSTPRPTAVVVAALAVVAAVGLVLLRPSTPAGSPLDLPRAVPAAPEAASSGSGPARERAEPDELVVDVAGAVLRPGLVRLPPGARVADAVAASGGPAPDAALVGLNQARVLADGEQVRVPRAGEPPPPPAPAPAPGPPGSGPAAPVDLNHATAAELDVLPGVGPATAAAIVAWRAENGGFRAVDDLLEVPGIGPARLERLRPHVRV